MTFSLALIVGTQWCGRRNLFRSSVFSLFLPFGEMPKAEGLFF